MARSMRCGIAQIAGYGFDGKLGYAAAGADQGAHRIAAFDQKTARRASRENRRLR